LLLCWGERERERFTVVGFYGIARGDIFLGKFWPPVCVSGRRERLSLILVLKDLPQSLCNFEREREKDREVFNRTFIFVNCWDFD